MTIAPFVHLRNHTAYSVAEGALTSDKIRDLCRKYGMPAAGITDTNNIFGGAEFSTHLEEVGVQPILGTQLDVDFNLPTTSFPKNRYSQLIFLVKNDVGYHNLIKLISYAHLRKKDEELPHINVDMLEMIYVVECMVVCCFACYVVYRTCKHCSNSFWVIRGSEIGFLG